MNKFLLCFLTFLLEINFVFAEVVRLSAEYRLLVESTQNPELILQVKNLPAPIITALGKAANDPQYPILNPNEKMQTGVASRRSLTDMSRLIWATKIKDFIVVHYESAGTANISQIGSVKMKNDSNSAQIVWTANSNRKFATYQDFLWTPKDNKLDDRFAYLG